MTQHVDVGYAQTSHASQGRTVDTALLLIDSPTDSRGVYTPMTRRRESNHAYVVTEDHLTALDFVGEAISRGGSCRVTRGYRRVGWRVTPFLGVGLLSSAKDCGWRLPKYAW